MTIIQQHSEMDDEKKEMYLLLAGWKKIDDWYKWHHPSVNGGSSLDWAYELQMFWDRNNEDD
jgi:hypothetical protein